MRDKQTPKDVCGEATSSAAVLTFFIYKRIIVTIKNNAMNQNENNIINWQL